jgi:hypothetical protein
MSIITIDSSDPKSIASAIKAGITTPELLADFLDDGEIVDDAVVIDPLYYATDCGGGVGDGFDTTEEAVEDFASAFDAPEETKWLEITTFRIGVDADGDIVRVDVERHTRTLEPNEPECTDGEHDWQSPFEIFGGLKENPGTWGHGGGAIIHECCVKCGCGRVTDTWAQNPNNGSQGHRTVSYEEGKYADEIAALAESE